MKKQFSTVIACIFMLSLFSGCRKETMPMPTSEPTRPLNTVAPSSYPTVPEETRETVSPVTKHTSPTVSPSEPTIEDGNGPIASQTPEARIR